MISSVNISGRKGGHNGMSHDARVIKYNHDEFKESTYRYVAILEKELNIRLSIWPCLVYSIRNKTVLWIQHWTTKMSG